VEEGAEAQRRAAGHLVGQGLGEKLADFGGALAGETAEVALDLERVLEDRERVPVHVEMMVGALPNLAQGLQLRQDDRRQLQLVEQCEAPQGVGTAEQLAQLGELALAGRVGGLGGCGAGPGGGAGLDLQLELGGEAGGAQQAQRIGREAALADRAQNPALEVLDTAVRVDRLAAGKWNRNGADREVAFGEIGFDALAAKGGRVDLPGPLASDDAPGAELGRELEGMLAEAGGDRLGRRPRVAGDGEVEVGDLAPEGGVANGAADDPGVPPVREGAPGGADQRRRIEPLGQPPAARRGTRAEIPQVTS
jgi:hypothetical protein